MEIIIIKHIRLELDSILAWSISAELWRGRGIEKCSTRSHGGEGRIPFAIYHIKWKVNLTKPIYQQASNQPLDQVSISNEPNIVGSFLCLLPLFSDICMMALTVAVDKLRNTVSTATKDNRSKITFIASVGANFFFSNFSCILTIDLYNH